MTEEHTQYTVSGLLIENELLRERVEALRKTADGFTDASSFQWGEYQRRIKELEAQVARLEQDNRRLRHLDAMPMDALRRFHNDANMVDPVYVESGQFDNDHGEVVDWLATLDGDA